ncbi:hypothetical protein FE257_002627 [Aspergillus nanangensis]|uniref:Uncharacterized protein n=1 Tax=Aspergillus nanangensis TaxID=2582783 RepID=A0AAD4GP03_ASPNN|nr:hypothetical protein FE257_002627 [Aspergillus nanangensis]
MHQHAWYGTIAVAFAVLVAAELIRRVLKKFDEDQRRARPHISGPIHIRLINQNDTDRF